MTGVTAEKHDSFISPVAEKVIVGKGFAGYAEAIGYFAMRSDPSRLWTDNN